ncbi:MAG: sigma-70 family RNA polymerase sigma factor [Cellulosilyticaceae bacterium]
MRITEENFLERLRCKDEKALDYVIDHYGWVVQSVVKQKLYNLQSYHEECINDILLGIWHNSECFNPEKSTFKNWIAGISKYKCIDYQRKYLKETTYEAIDEVVLEEADSTYENLLQEEVRTQIDELLSNLKEQDRELFLAIYEEECRVEVLSQRMGIKESAIYNRMSRAKKKLRKLFGTV